jgi:D-alanyl-D-alanine carboxypeptidase/D-alanyl-D-alanine-endopeptidase (penicillin-binding protein 4)
LKALVPLLGLAFAFAACSHAGPSGPPVPSPTPLWIPKPVPTWDAAQREDVQHTLSTIFDDDITRTATGLAVVAGDGSTLFTRRATIPVAPASTLKLVIAASALDLLGPKYRFETKLVSSVPQQPVGTLQGDVWLVGGGDPSLTSDDLRRGVGVLYRTGIRQIDGALQVDATAFSGPEQNPRWDPDDLTYDYAAGTSAISLDEDTVEFDVTPDPDGGSAHIKVVPDNDAITFQGTIRTVSANSDSEMTIERQPDASPQRGIGGLRRPDVNGDPHNEFDVDGYIAQGETQKFYKPVLGIPGYVGGALASMLAERGIALTGGYRIGAAPPGAIVLWDHRSATLDTIVREMLVNSNNHTAETLLRILGEQNGRAGTEGAGIAVEKRELTKFGVPRDRMAVYDGSGLAPGDRIMPLTLAELLAAEARGPDGNVFVRSLPLVGVEGTVKSHDLHQALGRTRAKSGHIEDVNGLAGTIATAHHGRVAFAFVVNDPRANADVVYQEEDRALDALAAY